MSDEFISWGSAEIDAKAKPLIAPLCNLLYWIDLDDKDRQLLHRTFRKNKKLLSQIGLTKADFNDSVMRVVNWALLRKYSLLKNADAGDSPIG